jgi:SAM-dependent methyltransferase
MAGPLNRELEAEIGSYWDERAESYSNGVRGELGDARSDAWRSSLERVTCGYLVDTSTNGRKPRVLDLGCGPGFFSVLFSEMGCEIDAMDASGEMLGRARTNVQVAGFQDSVAFHQGDVTELPFPDNTFDIVASRNLMWLMRDPEAAYAEWMRVLRPGGKLVVYDANWYLYLFDEEVDARRRADQDGNRVEEWAEDACATSAEERRCEQFALELPLSTVIRPAWDLETLERLGAAHVSADEDAWLDLWTESESRFYESSPLFMVEAVKAVA